MNWEALGIFIAGYVVGMVTLFLLAFFFGEGPIEEDQEGYWG